MTFNPAIGTQEILLIVAVTILLGVMAYVLIDEKEFL